MFFRLKQDGAINRSLRDLDSFTLFNIKGQQIKPFFFLRFLPSQLLFLLTTAVAITLFFPFVSGIETFDVPKEGEVAMQTVIAPFTFDILKSSEEIQKERQDIIESLLLVLDYNMQVKKRVEIKFLNLRSQIAMLSGKNVSDSIKYSIRMQLRKQFSENAINYLIKKPEVIDIGWAQANRLIERGIIDILLVSSLTQLNDLKIKYNSMFENYRIYRRDYVVMRKDTLEAMVNIIDIPTKEIALEIAIDRLRANPDFDAAGLNVVYELLEAYLEPNVSINEQESNVRKEKALSEVLPTKGKVLQNTELVRKHQIVTADIREKLYSLREAQRRLDKFDFRKKAKLQNAGKLFLALLPLGFLVFFLNKFNPKFLKNSKHCAALASIIILQVAIIRLVLYFIDRMVGVEPDNMLVVSEYSIPILVAPMFASVLFDLTLSLVVALFISIYLGVVLGFNYSLFLFSFFSGIVAAFMTRDIRYRHDFFKAIPPILAIQIVLIILWHVVAYQFVWGSFFKNILLAFVNSMSSILLVMSLTTIFENLFDITTNMTLIELADMNHPVIKRLSIEASGTYNHSILVGNLAESAAEKINAKSLLARVISYYHDIGKIEKADYFIENVIGDRNRHSKLTPNMSALIISSHVKEGVELACKYKLPKVIRDAILQHHGTSSVSFFYEKALEKDPHKQVKEEDFCYPGPIPQTRENAILMLADSVEAASRSLASSSPKLLRELVKKIIKDKFTSGQLDQCDLTLRDLDQIVEGFMPILTGMFHSRIEYPNTQ